LEGLRNDEGVVIEVWCPSEGAFTAELTKRGLAYKVLPFANWAYTLRSFGLWLFPLKWWLSQRKLSLFERELQAFSPDIIHSNSSVVSLGALLSARSNVPHLWHIREYGWLDYQLFFPLGNRFIQYYHQKAAAFIAISACIRRSVLPHITNKPPIYTIFNGVGKRNALALWANNTANNTPDNTRKTTHFLIIGLVHPSKNQLQALRAFRLAYRQNPQLRLEIVGSGRKIYLLRLQLLARYWGIAAAVTFTDYVSNPDSVYQNADVVLMCSPNEGMGRVTAEAMVRCKTVIGYNAGATPELIDDGKNGFLYDGSDADLCEKMLWVAQNRDFCTTIGQNAHQFVMANCTDEQYVAACYKVMQAVATPKH
jgi:glycosyltransferase involved in cell wall biosynthesis